MDGPGPLPPRDDRGPTRVGIGLIRRGDAYLIRVRPPGSPMPGVWEFPGGKCEPGEEPRDAAIRECLEETGLDVHAGEVRRRVLHRYPHGLVELSYFDCTPASPHHQPDPESGFRWIPAADLVRYRFPEANGPIVAELVREAERRAGS